MTTATKNAFSEEIVEVADLKVQLRKSGQGDPLLILHSELGVPGWLEVYQELAKHYTVYVPSLPGFGETTRPDWIVTVRDVAAWVAWFVREMNLAQPLNVIGFSMGGWVAAEIATVNQHIFKNMTLVAPAGLKSEEGETWDYFVHSGKDAFEQAFFNPEGSAEYARFYGRDWTPEEEEQVELNREMAARLLWKPYMRSHTLPILLHGISTPTQVLWGREDQIIPLGAFQQYQFAIKGAKATVMEGCGHMPEMEKPQEFTKNVTGFFANGA
jgi:pimeloyl-ACP methyl ester carboxylesterase